MNIFLCCSEGRYNVNKSLNRVTFRYKFPNKIFKTTILHLLLSSQHYRFLSTVSLKLEMFPLTLTFPQTQPRPLTKTLNTFPPGRAGGGLEDNLTQYTEKFFLLLLCTLILLTNQLGNSQPTHPPN